jgi:transcriptional regulator with XRE-family HTH domain
VTRGSHTSSVGGAVKAARTRLGWSRETLAHQSGLSWAAITQIETGRRTEVRLSSLVVLAKALGVSLDYLGRGNVAPTMLEHSAYVFTSPDDLAELVHSEVTAALSYDHAVLVVTTKPNLDAVRTSLGRSESRVTFADSIGWYTTPTEATARYEAFARDALDKGSRWIDIFGEPVWTGRSRSETLAWTRYESILNLVFAPWPVSVRCLYDVNATSAHVRTDVERTHPEVVSIAGRKACATYEEPVQFVTS